MAETIALCLVGGGLVAFLLLWSVESGRLRRQALDAIRRPPANSEELAERLANSDPYGVGRNDEDIL